MFMKSIEIRSEKNWTLKSARPPAATIRPSCRDQYGGHAARDHYQDTFPVTLAPPPLSDGRPLSPLSPLPCFTVKTTIKVVLQGCLRMT